MHSSKKEEYSVDEIRYDYYNDGIHISFVELICELNHCNYSDESNILPKMTNADWCNSDIGQILNILTDKVAENDKKLKLIRIKHSLKQTGRETIPLLEITQLHG